MTSEQAAPEEPVLTTSDKLQALKTYIAAGDLDQLTLLAMVEDIQNPVSKGDVPQKLVIFNAEDEKAGEPGHDPPVDSAKPEPVKAGPDAPVQPASAKK